MNSKAIRKQLLAAVAMVLVAAIALGSSTYAWFVQAGKVTATGMEVNVESTGGLIISYCGLADAWGTTATANMTAKKLKPVSTYNFTDWSTADALKASESTMNKSTIKNVKTEVLGNDNVVDDDNPYVVMREFKIRATNADCKGLYVDSVSVKAGDTATAQNLSRSLRVGLRWKVGTSTEYNYGDDNTCLIMAPVKIGNATPTYEYSFYSTAATADGDAKAVEAVVPGENTAVILGSGVSVPSTDGGAVVLQILIWYEGQDSQLFTDNVLVDENLSVSVVFSSSGVTA